MPVQISKFILQPFAKSGTKNDIPQSSSESTGNAGYDKGFPDVTMINVAAGGKPPFGQDFNGIFYDLSSIVQFLQSGQFFTFNQDFANSIDGYGVGAIVSDNANSSVFWINNSASNKQFPTGWTRISLGIATQSIPGLSRIATQDELSAGLVDDAVATPKKLRFGFKSLIGRRGYIALPTWLGGFIIQWGDDATPTGGFSANVLFPMPFPNGCYQVVATHGGYNGAGTRDFPSVSLPSKNGFTIYSSTSDMGFYWIAVGT